MPTLLFVNTSTQHDPISDTVSAIPQITFEGLKIVKNTIPNQPHNNGFPLAKIFEENLGKPSKNMNHIKKLDAYFHNIKKEELHLYRLLTINYPLKHHFLYTSKQLSKKMRAEISSLRRYGSISTAFTVFEYSKDFKFHCHSLIKVMNIKKLNNKLKYLRSKTHTSAFHLLKPTSMKSIDYFVRYLAKDILYMTSKKELSIQCGSFHLEDILNYNPVEVKAKLSPKLRSSPKNWDYHKKNTFV